jgi:hypothetical protein
MVPLQVVAVGLVAARIAIEWPVFRPAPTWPALSSSARKGVNKIFESSFDLYL